MSYVDHVYYLLFGFFSWNIYSIDCFQVRIQIIFPRYLIKMMQLAFRMEVSNIWRLEIKYACCYLYLFRRVFVCDNIWYERKIYFPNQRLASRQNNFFGIHWKYGWHKQPWWFLRTQNSSLASSATRQFAISYRSKDS